MREFVATASKQLAQLPTDSALPNLTAEASNLRVLVEAKAEPGIVAAQAHSVAAALLKAYPFPIAPSKILDLACGATLFATNCAVCHGATGRADVPLAANLSPPPANLADHTRSRERSLFAFHQIVTQGVGSTAMVSFKDKLSNDTIAGHWPSLRIRWLILGLTQPGAARSKRQMRQCATQRQTYSA
jgi:high-affinity iron transporter